MEAGRESNFKLTFLFKWFWLIFLENPELATLLVIMYVFCRRTSRFPRLGPLADPAGHADPPGPGLQHAGPEVHLL